MFDNVLGFAKGFFCINSGATAPMAHSRNCNAAYSEMADGYTDLACVIRYGAQAEPAMPC